MNDRYELPELPQQVAGMVVIAALILFVLFFPVVAALVAPEGRRGTFFLLTFLLILPGPLGVACAAIASPRPNGSSRPAPGEYLTD